jgi:hypothetical protein
MQYSTLPQRFSEAAELYVKEAVDYLEEDIGQPVDFYKPPVPPWR